MKNQRRGEVKGEKEEGAEADDDDDGMKRRGRASQSLEPGLEKWRRKGGLFERRRKEPFVYHARKVDVAAGGGW